MTAKPHHANDKEKAMSRKPSRAPVPPGSSAAFGLGWRAHEDGDTHCPFADLAEREQWTDWWNGKQARGDLPFSDAAVASSQPTERHGLEVFLVCSRVELPSMDADCVLHVSTDRVHTEELLSNGAFVDQVGEDGAFLVLARCQANALVNTTASMPSVIAYYHLAGGPALQERPDQLATTPAPMGQL